MATVLIYSTPYCPYCVQAKHLLEKKGINYEEINVAQDPQLRTKMQQLSGAHTVPQIFINDQAIGGCDELYALERANQLDSLLV